MDYCPHCMRPATGKFCPACGGQIQWKAPSCQLPVGTLLRGSTGRVYQIGAAKGQGGFGITYAALDLENWNRLAIKEYFPSSSASRDNRNGVIPTTGQQDSYHIGMKHFLEEGRMLSSVGALPSVVSVRDSFEANGTAYIVMEYVEGLPLHEVVKRRGRIPWQELLPMLSPLMRDLDILHRAGVIHRDISPDNLILTPEHTLKLLDFGSARSVNSGNMTVMLKTGFSPVEQYQSSGQGPFTDVYALAATLYYCLTGVIPPSSIDRLNRDTLAEPNPQALGLTGAQVKALLWGMARQPSERPQTMRQFMDALLNNGARKPERVSYRPPQPEPPRTDIPNREPAQPSRSERQPAPTPRKKKNRLPLILGSCAAALAVIVGAVLLLMTLGTGKTSQGIKYRVRGDEVWITGYEGSSTVLAIPGKIEGHPVTRIGSGAFSGCSSLNRVTIPGQVSSVERNAFRGCGNLELVTFEASATAVELADSAFSGCDSLRCLLAEQEDRIDDWDEDTLPNGAVCYLGQQLPQGRIREIQISGDVAYAITDLDCAVAQQLPSDGSKDLPPYLGDYRVFDPKGTRVTAPGGVVDDVVYEVYNGKGYIVGYQGTDWLLSTPDEVEGCPVTVICSGAFDGCTELESVLLPTELTTIQAEAFRDCPQLRDLEVYSKPQVSAAAIRNCPLMRCVTLKGSGASVSAWELPAGCRSFEIGMETGVGPLSFVTVKSTGEIYGVTEDKSYVLMDVPAGATQVDVQEDTVWVYAGALTNVSADVVINMAPNMGFPLELYSRADWEFTDLDDFSFNWMLTCETCIAINKNRSGLDQIYPDRATVNAAMIRSQELIKRFDYTRPSGASIVDFLNDQGVDWDYSTQYINRFSNSGDALSQGIDDSIQAMAEEYATTNSKGLLFTKLGAAMYYASDGKMYVSGFGIAME